VGQVKGNIIFFLLVGVARIKWKWGPKMGQDAPATFYCFCCIAPNAKWVA